MSEWVNLYVNLLGLGTFCGTVALGLAIEARWIGLPRHRRIGRWSVRL